MVTLRWQAAPTELAVPHKAPLHAETKVPFDPVLRSDGGRDRTGDRV
jgi:hypothetical protein